jgi:rhodanese-related sulfurtransferase
MMKKLSVFLIFIVLTISSAVFSGEVKRIDKDELKAMLGNPDLVILDVRTGKDWSSSEFKIKDAVRLTDENMEAVIPKFSKDSTLVFYCA